MKNKTEDRVAAASACLTSPHADRVSMVCWKFAGPQALVVGASGDLERHHSARQTVSLRVPRLLVGDVEAMDRGPTTSARSSDLLITLVASAVVKRGDQCVAEDGQPAALSALLIGRPSGGESFVKGASPSTPTRAHTRSSSSRGIHHPGRYSMQTSSSRFARCNFRARYCH